MLLAIDTATRYMNLSLHDGDTVLADQTWHIGRKHNEHLAPAIRQMLDMCNVAVDDVSVLAVATGPGSYTSLRIGVSMAKGMADARRLPLIGISTLDMLAAGQPFNNTRHQLLAVIQAGRGRIIAGEYSVQRGRWEAAGDPQILKWSDLLTAERLGEASYYITGEVNAAGREAIASARSTGLSLTLVSAVHRVRRAGFLAQEAWRVFRLGDESNFPAGAVMPVYLNEPG